ncbi:MAG: methyltransferase domain-containing protein [Actinomycetota bacterium]|nr:methyltransferase domain-containing protein [Actinomycetota bacterium]
MDPDDFRAESRARWEGAAAGWVARRPAFQRAAQPVSMAMIDLLEPQPGHTVLELAAGPGDTGLLAAELVQPGGKVVITDGAEGMVEVARRRAEELGVANVEVRQMEAEWIDLPAASVDGVVCRWGYMLLADPGAAFRETRRVLRPGGRVALAAWTDYDHNAWFNIIGRALGEDRPQPGLPGPFGFAEPGHVDGLLEEAGFDEILVETLDFTMRMPSKDAYFEHQRALSTRFNAALAGMTPAEHARVRDEIDRLLEPFLGAEGSVALPARTWIASALG